MLRYILGGKSKGEVGKQVELIKKLLGEYSGKIVDKTGIDVDDLEIDLETGEVKILYTSFNRALGSFL